MKKTLSIFAALFAIMLLVYSCDKPKYDAGVSLGTRFLTVPAEQTYMPACGIDLCFCEHEKGHFAFP